MARNYKLKNQTTYGYEQIEKPGEPWQDFDVH